MRKGRLIAENSKIWVMYSLRREDMMGMGDFEEVSKEGAHDRVVTKSVI